MQRRRILLVEFRALALPGALVARGNAEYMRRLTGRPERLKRELAPFVFLELCREFPDDPVYLEMLREPAASTKPGVYITRWPVVACTNLHKIRSRTLLDCL